MPLDPSIKALAKGIVDSAKRHEDSYNKAAADAATAAIEDDDNEHVFVDYSKFYRLTPQQACEPEGELAMPIYLLLTYSWNDALNWANDQLKQEN